MILRLNMDQYRKLLIDDRIANFIWLKVQLDIAYLRLRRGFASRALLCNNCYIVLKLKNSA